MSIVFYWEEALLEPGDIRGIVPKMRSDISIEFMRRFFCLTVANRYFCKITYEENKILFRWLIRIVSYCNKGHAHLFHEECIRLRSFIANLPGIAKAYLEKYRIAWQKGHYEPAYMRHVWQATAH